MKLIQTECGKALYIKTISKIENDGSIALFLLLDNDDKPECYALLYERGGDWMVFGDGDELYYDALDGWEPYEIKHAIRVIGLTLPDNQQILEDMEWFSEWAQAAERTLKSCNSNEG